MTTLKETTLERGRLVTILPVVHSVYKLSLEFYVWAASAGWENVFHITLGTDNLKWIGHRHPTLYIVNASDDRLGALGENDSAVPEDGEIGSGQV